MGGSYKWLYLNLSSQSETKCRWKNHDKTENRAKESCLISSCCCFCGHWKAELQKDSTLNSVDTLIKMHFWCKNVHWPSVRMCVQSMDIIKIHNNTLNFKCSDCNFWEKWLILSLIQSHSQVIKHICFKTVVRLKFLPKVSVFDDLAMRLNNQLSFSRIAFPNFKIT